MEQSDGKATETNPGRAIRGIWLCSHAAHVSGVGGHHALLRDSCCMQAATYLPPLRLVKGGRVGANPHSQPSMA
jgi:hypothetical protein